MKGFALFFGVLLVVGLLCLASPAIAGCPGGLCAAPVQQVVVRPVYAQPVVLQQVAHPVVRQQFVQPVVRQQVIRQSVVAPAPSVQVIRRGIFGIPRTTVRVN